MEKILWTPLGRVGRGGLKRGRNVYVLRGVVEKRERGHSGGLLGLGGGVAKGGCPYVIVMIGINGALILGV